LSNKSRLNTYLRDISNQTGVPFEAIQQTFDDKALQQLVADREARGEEVDLCLERTPKEREEYLQGFDSILALNNYNDLTIDGIAGVKYDPGTMYPGDLVQEVIARLSFTLKNQTFAPGTVREIMKDPQAWKNDLDQMGKILQEQAREIFELSKASYMRSEGIRDISQEQNEILMRKCDRRLKGPLRNLVFPFDFSLQGIRKFRTFDPPEPRLIY